MKLRLLALIACPACGGPLQLAKGSQADGEILEGLLRCRRCSATYPIRGGVARLLPAEISADKLRTAEAFGWEWTHFRELHGEYRDQFLDWIHPIDPSYFEGKVVLDAGCGTGRHAFFAAEFGAREVVGLDLSDAVDTAFSHIGRWPNVHIVQGDILNPPFLRGAGGGPFDFAYAIGVLHHLPDPRAGFRSLVRFLRPEGAIFAWVYGHENNGVVHHLIDPVRKNVTTRLPAGAVNGLAWPLTVVLHVLVRGVYRPLRETGAWRRLPSHTYLTSLAAYSFRQNHSIVFDHLVAPTAFYIRRHDFEEWFRAADLTGVRISWRNENSWRGFGQRA